MEVRRLLLVTHPAERMYDLIEAAEHYPAFLPWCASANVTERNDALVAADIVVDWHGVRFDFATRNEKRRPHWMGVRLARGPFREFAGEWELTPLGEEGCRVAFLLRYDFSTPLLARVASHVFERITNTLVDAFVARADELGPAIPVPLPVPLPEHASSAKPPSAPSDAVSQTQATTVLPSPQATAFETPSSAPTPNPGSTPF
jgi:ribosome-associated toxin RatA of RatAB toxin-antitoxin module